ncbi:Kinesin-like protein KIN-7D, mitochondrial [Orobanche gracilis]
MSASSSRGRSSSPFGYGKPSTPNSSTASSSSVMNGRLMPRSCSSSVQSSYGGGGGGRGGVGYSSRSTTPSRNKGDYPRNRSYPSLEEKMIGEPIECASRSGDSISVTIRFRPLSEREYQRGDEIAWYADGDKIVRNEYNPMTSYAFDKVFGPNTNTQEVYEVAARPVVKAAMEGVNGTVFAYGVTSSGKTHTMHGDQSSPGIIPLAIKDVFNIIQDTPGREFLLRVSYLEIYNEGTYVESIKEEVVLSPGHALSFIAAGEEHRHVGSNNFNLFSSRSHTIFTLISVYPPSLFPVVLIAYVRSPDVLFGAVAPSSCYGSAFFALLTSVSFPFAAISNFNNSNWFQMIESSAHGDDYDGVIFSQLNLIDLAGSESSKTETTGLRRKEGSYINKSLLTLGTVIGKLSEGKASHVPYRDSKLTRLLQSSLSGHGHVSLICTITPASSNMEETHNTLKFASRAKRVEINASRNRIIDEKSLIKKYQREISCLKEELDQLRRGMLTGVSPEEIMVLKQQLEAGQFKMQSRLEEEEEAKAALMSRIQRLTKLILVSSKNTIPGYTNDVPFASDHDKLEGQNVRDSSFCALTITSDPYNNRQRISSSKWNDDISQTGSTLTEMTQAGELISGCSSVSKLSMDSITVSDQMDLFVEQVKMLDGEIAFSTSTLKRLVEQSVNDPESSKTQIQNLEHEIHEKRKRMRVLEQRIAESGEASIANASMVEMQQTVMKLTAQCNEKGFELEIKSADNRILQEQLEKKYAENKEFQEKILHLKQQLASVSVDKIPSPPESSLSDENADELGKKIQSQEIANEKLKLEHVQIIEENSGLRVQNQKLSEEASYAKELASAAAVELKNLAGEVTKLSLQNAKLETELQSARELSFRSRRPNDVQKTIRRGRLSNRSNDELDSWNLDPDDLKLELQARKQREAALEAALTEKEILEDEYRKKAEESKKRETALESDLANMWVLVAQLRKEGINNDLQEHNTNHRQTEEKDRIGKVDKEQIVKDWQAPDNSAPALDIPKEEPLVVRLKARMQEMKEKELRYIGTGDANSHVCKVCFESPSAAMLLPCRHYANHVPLRVLNVLFAEQRS